jgi:hypothetical protein
VFVFLFLGVITMKKSLFSLLLSAAVLTTNPLFAMDEPSLETCSRDIVHTIHKAIPSETDASAFRTTSKKIYQNCQSSQEWWQQRAERFSINLFPTISYKDQVRNSYCPFQDIQQANQIPLAQFIGFLQHPVTEMTYEEVQEWSSRFNIDLQGKKFLLKSPHGAFLNDLITHIDPTLSWSEQLPKREELKAALAKRPFTHPMLESLAGQGNLVFIWNPTDNGFKAKFTIVKPQEYTSNCLRLIDQRQWDPTTFDYVESDERQFMDKCWNILERPAFFCPQNFEFTLYNDELISQDAEPAEEQD